MTDVVGQAALEIVPEISPTFGSQLSRGTSGAMITSGSRGGRAYGDSAGRSMASAFAGHAKRAAATAGVGLGLAAYAVVGLARSSLAEARESQKVGALTEQVIKTTGQAANVTAEQVGNLSGALSAKAGIDDEVIQAGANMLLTFKDIRNEVGANNDIFNQATAITTDMAAAMAGGRGGDIDLKSSSIQVGKALNDPIKGITALSKVGVSFTEQQRDQIEALVESGDKMAAQKIILGELKTEFGGAAAAQATLGDKVDVAWGNIQERLGTAILPLVDDAQRAFLDKGVPAVEKFIDVFTEDGIPAIRDFADDVRPLAESVLPALGTALGTARDIVGEIAPKLKTVFDGFNDLPDWAQSAIVMGAGGAAVAGKLGALPKLGGKSGGGGVLGGVLGGGVQKVFVTNPGFGGKGGVPGGVAVDSDGRRTTGTTADDRRSGGGRRRGSVLDSVLPIPSLPLALLYGGLGPSSQAPGQSTASGTNDASKNLNLQMDALKVGPEVALGATSVEQFDAALSKLTDDAARFDAIKDFATATDFTFWEKGATDVDLFNKALPKTQEALGMTATKFAENYQAGKDMNRIFDLGSDSASDFVENASGLSSQIGNKLTPRMADAQAAAGQLGGELRRVPKDVDPKFTTPGLSVANDDAGKFRRLVDTTGKTKADPRFSTPGLPKARNDSGDLLNLLERVGQPFAGSVSIDTGDAYARLSALRGEILTVLSLMNFGVGAAAGAAQRPASRATGGGKTSRSQAKLVVGDREFEAYIDERIGAAQDLVDQRGRATR